MLSEIFGSFRFRAYCTIICTFVHLWKLDYIQVCTWKSKFSSFYMFRRTKSTLEKATKENKTVWVLEDGPQRVWNGNWVIPLNFGALNTFRFYQKINEFHFNKISLRMTVIRLLISDHNYALQIGTILTSIETSFIRNRTLFWGTISSAIECPVSKFNFTYRGSLTHNPTATVMRKCIPIMA